MSLSVNGSTGYGWMFGSASNNSSRTNFASLTSAMFGNSSSILGEYSMIKSGTYYKLLKAYYDSVDNTEKPEESTTPSIPKQEVDNLTAYESTYKGVKTSADSLNNAAKALSNEKIYEGTKAEDGTVTYDKDAIVNKVNKFVSSYNDYMASTQTASSARLMEDTYKIQGEILSNTKALQGIGITYAKGSLHVDEAKLKAANVEDIAAIFKGEDSIAGKVSTAATDASKVSYSLANTGSMYNASGTYIPSASYLLDSLM